MSERPSYDRLSLKVYIVLICIAIVCWNHQPTTVLSAPLFEDPSPTVEAEYVPGELLVKLKEGTTELADASRMLSAQQLAAASPVPELGIWNLAVTPGQELEQMRALQELPEVEYVEPNYIASAQETPDDPELYRQWGLDKIDAPEGWDYTHGGASVVIAIVDTGIDGTHPDLSTKVQAGYNFISSSPIPAHTDSDDNYHGTHVAGIAAAITDNGIGIAGLGWEPLLMPVKVLDDDGYGTYEDVALGIRYAADNGAQIINMSLGGPSHSDTLDQAVDYAYGKGCLLTAAAGNSNYGFSTPLLYPAECDNVMAVGNTNSSDVRYYNSQYGDQLDVMAPGTSIYSTLPTNSYGYLTGTSMSTPLVSGLAALVWTVVPDESNDEVQEIIQANAVDLGDPGWDQYYGYGRIDALATLQAVVEVTVSPSEVSFLADDQTEPIPSYVDLLLETSSPDEITWTATISCTTGSWLTRTPGSGSVSASAPTTIQLEADKSGLNHGDYECDLLIDCVSGGSTLTTTAEISLHYVSELIRMRLPLVGKSYTN